MLKMRAHLPLAIGVIFSALGVTAAVSRQASASPDDLAAAAQVPVSSGSIGGVVRGSAGPEAGVWVIAETRDLPTKFWKIVVTDDQGRFVVPDLPMAKYKVWVRGYGLLDSVPVEAARGERLTLRAVKAPDARSAAQVYPPNYWYSLMQVPPSTAFPQATPQPAPSNDDIEARLVHPAQSQAGYIYEGRVCFACHQLGDKATREFPPGFNKLGKFETSVAKWRRRVKSSQLGDQMWGVWEEFPPSRALPFFAQWTDRIVAGEVPPAPPRPQGLARDVVITGWEWGKGLSSWVHDDISTDKRDPTVNPYGLVYGAGVGDGALMILNPKTNSVREIPTPVRADRAAMLKGSFLDNHGHGGQSDSSPYLGDKKVWTDPDHPHNVMLDERGRLWMTTRVRPIDQQPTFCKDGSADPYARNYPLDRSERQAALFDPKTGKWIPIDTCFSTHHLQFAYDRDDTLYFSGDNDLVGWLDTKEFLKTGNVEAAEGWCPAYIDKNGNGRFDRGTDPTVRGSAYGIGIDPIDGSVWYAAQGLPGQIVRIARGSNPPATCSTEVYEPPFGDAKAAGGQGDFAYSPKGLDFDRHGVVWVTLGSGQLASFDRRKCRLRSGPTATGQQCPEGWRLYPLPGPQLRGAQQGETADFSYFDWVDQAGVFGLGKNVPMALGSNSDSLLILRPATGKWIQIRVPYPMGYFSRGVDGRIDDPKAGWKGRGLWTNSSDIPVWHQEGGVKAKPFIMHIQLRPSPLAD